MSRPQDRFGSVGGHFYERGLIRTPSGRRQRIAKRYVRKTRPASRKVDLTKKPRTGGPPRPYTVVAMLFSMLALVGILSTGEIIPWVLFITLGAGFLVIGQQRGAAEAEK